MSFTYLNITKFAIVTSFMSSNEVFEPDFDLTEILLDLDLTEDLLELLGVSVGASMLLYWTTGTWVKSDWEITFQDKQNWTIIFHSHEK